MSHFYGSMAGKARTQATRCGTKSSGVSAHVRGWNVGVQTEAHHTEEGDEVRIVLTHGSTGRGSNVTIGKVMEHDGKTTFYMNPEFFQRITNGDLLRGEY